MYQMRDIRESRDHRDEVLIESLDTATKRPHRSAPIRIVVRLPRVCAGRWGAVCAEGRDMARQVVGYAREQGMEPTRDLVEDLVDSARGELDFETFKQRAVQRATRGEGARNAAT